MKKCMIVLAGFILLLAGCPRIEGGGKPSPTVTEYTVTFSHTPKEGGNLTAKIKDGGAFISGAKAAENTVLEFTAEPASTYSVGNWSGEGLTVSADKKTATLKVSKAVNVTVTFVTNGTPTPPPTGKEYTVTFLHTPKEGGNLTAKIKGGGAFISGTKAAENTVLEFTAEPASNYSVGSWSGEGLTVSADKKSATLKVSKAVNVTVTFVTNGTPTPPPTGKEYKVTYSHTPDEGGILTAKIQGGGTFTSGDKVPENTVLEFTAMPKDGYRVKEWTGATVGAGDKTKATLIVTGNAEVKVVFEAIPKYKITFSAEPKKGGNLTAKIKDGGAPVQSGDTLPAGTVVLFTAEPKTEGNGYYILRWSGEDLKVSSDKKTAELTVKKDTEVKVMFQKYLVENPNWEAVGILRTKDGTMKKFHMVISDGGKYFSFFDNSPGGGTYLAEMTYDKSTKTVTLKEPLAEGTIRCVLMKDFTPSEWEIDFRGVRAESLELPDQTVKVEVTLNDNSIS